MNMEALYADDESKWQNTLSCYQSRLVDSIGGETNGVVPLCIFVTSSAVQQMLDLLSWTGEYPSYFYAGSLVHR